MVLLWIRMDCRPAPQSLCGESTNRGTAMTCTVRAVDGGCWPGNRLAARVQFTSVSRLLARHGVGSVVAVGVSAAAGELSCSVSRWLSGALCKCGGVVDAALAASDPTALKSACGRSNHAIGRCQSSFGCSAVHPAPQVGNCHLEYRGQYPGSTGYSSTVPDGKSA